MSILNQIIENTANNVSIVEQAQTIPGMFSVEKTPISGPYGQIEKKKGLFVNKKCVNIVSDKYEVHQPSEIVKQFYDVAAKTGLEVNRIKLDPNNGGMLLSAKYKDLSIAGDKHDINIVFFTSHCGKYRTFLSLDTLRVACFNQLPALYRNKSRFIFSEKHYENALDIELIGLALEHLPESLNAHAEKLENLKDKQINLSDFADMYAKHNKMKKDAKQYQTKLDKLKAVYYNAPGQSGCPDNSAYKALQAITFLNTHEGKTTALKEQNAFIKGGNDSLVWLDNLLDVTA